MKTTRCATVSQEKPLRADAARYLFEHLYAAGGDQRVLARHLLNVAAPATLGVVVAFSKPGPPLALALVTVVV